MPSMCLGGRSCIAAKTQAARHEFIICLLMQGDAFKTLFVSRISFETTEKKLKRELEEYGPIKRIRLVQDAAG